jgi:hypothetical protein
MTSTPGRASLRIAWWPNFSIRIGQYQEVAEAATKKYGPAAKTVLHANTGRIETTLDGKVVATAEIKSRVEDVFGLFLVGARRNAMARFPFALKVSGQRDDQVRDVGRIVRGRFETQTPRLFDFNDLEWAMLWCWSQETPDPGARFADAQPRLGRADLCLVRWRRGESKTMLVGALAAEGGDWVRDAAGAICRTLTTQWLAMPEVTGRDGLVDYAACVLVHDPDRGSRGTSATTVEQIYEVRPDGPLLTIN